MEKKQKNTKARRYAKLFLFTWAIFFVLELVLFFVQYSFLPLWWIANSGMTASVAGMLAVFFYDVLKSRKERIRRFEFVELKHFKNFYTAKLPEKATEDSIGYDFFSPEKVTINPGEKHMFWTDVKVNLKKDEYLELSPRSSIGINKSLMLANTIGNIDPDYYGNADNDGNIGICMYNYGKESVTIEQGERFAQGIIKKFVRDIISTTSNKRIGGIGSTGK